MKHWNLDRVVTHAVKYALISGLSACSATAPGDDANGPVLVPGGDDATDHGNASDATDVTTDATDATTSDTTDVTTDTTDATTSDVTTSDTTDVTTDATDATTDVTTSDTTDVTTDTTDSTGSTGSTDSSTHTGCTGSTDSSTHTSDTTDSTTSTGSTTSSTSTESTTSSTDTSDTTDSTTSTGSTDSSTDTSDTTDSTTDGESSEQPPVDSVSLGCSDAGESLFEQMQLTATYDSIALRMTHESLLEEPPVETELSGAHCSGASDVDACLTLVDNAWPTPDSSWQRCGQIGCRSYGVLTTQGDEVTLAESLDAIAALLGPIDTPHEASLWAQANYHNASCDATSYRITTSGIVLDFEQMISECPVTFAEISLQVAPDGTLTELSRVELPDTGACIGRRPPGMLGVNAPCSGFEVGDYFAEVAALEGAAVEAFDVIRADLARFGAPETLLCAAEQAQADEVRHAQQMSALAVRYGATPAQHRSEPRRDQTLLEFALDNAVEGCIRETFGAACAAFQAIKARDPQVRVTLREIATDETRHAELSWKIHSWVESQLDAQERAQLAAAMHAAVAQLQVEVARAQPASVRLIAGVPNPADAAALLDDLQAQLWAPALAA